MRFFFRLALMSATVSTPALAYVDEPLPDRDGGGVLTCRECHLHTPEDAAAGMLSVHGLPEHYVPGMPYKLTVTLSHPALKRGGFEASVRTERGLQAGRLMVDDPRISVVPDGATGVVYVHHTRTGTAATHNKTSWSFTWTAPPKTAGKVIVRAAGNAANADDSPLGDAIIFFSQTVAPQ